MRLFRGLGATSFDQAYADCLAANAMAPGAGAMCQQLTQQLVNQGPQGGTPYAGTYHFGTNPPPVASFASFVLPSSAVGGGMAPLPQTGFHGPRFSTILWLGGGALLLWLLFGRKSASAPVTVVRSE